MQREGGVRDATEGENSSCWEPGTLKRKKKRQKFSKRKKNAAKCRVDLLEISLNVVGVML